jgi:calcium-independent phospholipase A2
MKWLKSDHKIKRPGDVFQDPWMVYPLKQKELQSLKVIRREKPLDLNKSFVYDTNEGSFEITFTLDFSTSYSIFRSRDELEAFEAFKILSPIIPSVMKGVTRRNNNKKKLSGLLTSITSCIRENQGWTPAHVASFLGLHFLFRDRVAEVVEKLNSQSNKKKDSPLHIALRSQDRKTVKAILSLDPNLSVVNASGNSILHEVSLTSVTLFKIIWQSFSVSRLSNDSTSWKLMSFRNNDNYTPLHFAALNGKTDIVMFALTLGLTVHQFTLSPPCLPFVFGDPDPDAKVVFTREMLKDLDKNEIKNAGCPLHWVTQRRTLDKLIEMKFNPKAANMQMESPVHVLTRTNRLSCLLGILSFDYTTNSLVTDKSQTSLHFAVKVENIPVVQALIVFDVDVNAVDNEENSARHYAASNKTQVSNAILHMLNAVGAERCPEGKIGCEEGCSFDGTFNGVPFEGATSFSHESLYREMLMKEVVSNALKKCGKYNPSESSEAEPRCQEKKSETNETKTKRRIRMLTLDGGGIRGLITASILCEMDSLLPYPLFNYIDWIVGTSTGSVIGSLLSLKYSPQDIRGLYFKLKDDLMSGSKPYSSKRFDELLKETFGESIVMNHIKDRKLTITSTIADRLPHELHLFRSYHSPEEVCRETESKEDYECNKNYLWSAIRASGAAPYFFSPHDKYIDGGLVANNPTLDGLTEFFMWEGSMRHKREMSHELGIIINIGTGKMPCIKLDKPLEIIAPLFSWNLRKTFRNAMVIWSFIEVLFEQCTMTDNQVVERSMAWCSSINVPHFRLCPPLSGFHTMDLVDDKSVVKLLFETKAYIHALKSQFEEMTRLLDYNETPEDGEKEYKKL